MIERINPEKMVYSGMSQAVKKDGRILVSGQVALSENGDIVGIGDAEAQAQQVFSNISRVLKSADATLADVVKLTCFLTDQSAYAGYAAVKNALFAALPPASTVVIIEALLMPDLLMEVEAEAWI